MRGDALQSWKTWLAIGVLGFGLVACDDPPPGGDGGDEGIWLELGQGENYDEGFAALANGDELVMVLGGQGILMFPMPLRGGGFPVPDDPADWMHPHAPHVDLRMIVDDYALYPGAALFCEETFACISNYPMGFREIDDESYLSDFYLTAFVPDELTDPCDIDGLPATIEVQLTTKDDTTSDLLSIDVLLVVPEDLCG